MEIQENMDTSSETLLAAWGDVTHSLSCFIDIVSTIKDYESMELTLCLRNGSRVDTFTLPRKLSTEGNANRQQGAHEDASSREESLGLMDSGVPNMDISRKTLSGTDDHTLRQDMLEYLKRCGIKHFRSFFTEVRRRLKMKTFDWPETAKSRFLTERNEPIPSAPGRANSGKQPLLYILKLSVEVDDAWRSCVRAILNEHVGHQSTLQDDHKSTDITDSDLSRAHEERYDEESDCELPRSDERDLTPRETEKIARGLPHDDLRVTIPRNAWVPLPILISSVSHPNVGQNIEWFIQRTPGDGNCMFSSILITAKLRGCLPASMDSVTKMRAVLREELLDLSRAGLINSKYRRDWLASCMHDIDDCTLEQHCYGLLEKARGSHVVDDMEDFLAPLRVFVSNWAGMVGSDHWGGLLRAELFILAAKCGVVIEVMNISKPSSVNAVSSLTNVHACDTRSGNRIAQMERRDLIYPFVGTLPSVDQAFTGPVVNVRTDNGWVGPYPLIRLLLHDRHYNACTAKYSYPISLVSKNITTSVSNEWFSFSDTLVEPFCSLSGEERKYYEKASREIQDWRDACLISPERGRHADSIVMHTKNSELYLSMLSNLQVPDASATDMCYLMSDEIMTSYMDLLQHRTEKLKQLSKRNGFKHPPRSMFMHTWLFKSLLRGPSGPSSTRTRLDLRPYSMILIPALVQRHWLLAVCYVEDGIIGVYDPMNASRHDVYNVVKTWAEAQLPNTNTSWNYLHIKETRECAQEGIIDCGIYVCKAAESLGIGIPVRISQVDIPYVRKRMIVEFIQQRASKVRWPRC